MTDGILETVLRRDRFIVAGALGIISVDKVTSVKFQFLH
jgi:hypothetical protein